MPRQVDKNTLRNISGANVLDAALATSQNIMQQRNAAQLRDLRSMEIQNAVQDWNERIYAAETVKMNADLARKQTAAKLKRADKLIQREEEAEDIAAVKVRLEGQNAAYDTLVGNIGSPQAFNSSLESVRGVLPTGVYQELKSLNPANPSDREILQSKLTHYRTQHIQDMHKMQAQAALTATDKGPDAIKGTTQAALIQKHLDENSSFEKDGSFGVTALVSQLGANFRGRGIDITDTQLADIASKLYDQNPEKYTMDDPKSTDWPLIGKVSSALNVTALEADVRNVVFNQGQVSPATKYSMDAGVDESTWNAIRSNPKYKNLSNEQLVARIKYNSAKIKQPQTETTAEDNKMTGSVDRDFGAAL